MRLKWKSIRDDIESQKVTQRAGDGERPGHLCLDMNRQRLMMWQSHLSSACPAVPLFAQKECLKMMSLLPKRYLCAKGKTYKKSVNGVSCRR